MNINTKRFFLGLVALTALYGILEFRSVSESDRTKIAAYNDALKLTSITDAQRYLKGTDLQLARYSVMGLSLTQSVQTRHLFLGIWNRTTPLLNKSFLDDPGIRVLSAKALLGYGLGDVDELRDYIYRMISYPEPEVRAFSIMALGSLGDSAAVDRLYELANSNNSFVARNAISALSTIIRSGKPGAGKAYRLLSLLKENNRDLSLAVKEEVNAASLQVSQYRNSGNAEIADGFNDAKIAFFDGDYNEAANLMLPFASKGNAEAQFYMGEIYSKGPTKDYTASEQWYKKSARQGYVPAEFALGNLFLGEPYRNFNKAAYWFERAAEHNNANAQRLLSQAYRKGWWGLEIDKEKSRYWENRARREGE